MSDTVLDSGAPSVPADPRSNSEMRLHQYVLVRQVGQGGAGSVWEAWDTRLARTVAIKTLNTTEPASVRRFEREAQIAAGLRHPNIATIHEVNEARGIHYLAMDFIDGASMAKAGLPLRAAVAAFVKVCRAVDHAHRSGVIHRDLKPQNIMLSSSGEPYVTDFGLAKVLSVESSLSVSGTILGTPAYMSPEQAEGRLRHLDARSDIYSLGATLYAVATGRPPFSAQGVAEMLIRVCTEDPAPPREFQPEITAGLEAVILKAMRKNPAERYASAAEFADDLERWLEGRAVEAKPAMRRATRRRLRIAGLAVAALALAAAAAAVPRGQAPVVRIAMPAKADVRPLLAFSDREFDPEPVREAIRAEPELLSRWVAGEIDALPRLWPEPFWESKRGEAARIVGWARRMLALFEGGRFASLRARLDRVVRDFESLERVPLERRRAFETLRPAGEIATFRSESSALRGADPRMLGAWIECELGRIPVRASLPDVIRLERWCRSMLEILDRAEPRLLAARTALRQAADRFARIAADCGKIRLKLYILPQAELRSFRIGERWVVREGKVVDPSAGRFPSGRLITPFVIDDLDIGDYTLDLDGRLHSIAARLLTRDRTYSFVGSTDKPAEYRLLEQN